MSCRRHQRDRRPISRRRITHAIVGATIGGIAGRFERFKPLHKLGMTTLGLLCGIAPDLDVVNHAWTRYQDFCGHRGFFHSPFFFLVFAVVLGVLVRDY